MSLNSNHKKLPPDLIYIKHQCLRYYHFKTD